MFCGECGAKLNEGSSFCGNCGAKVNAPVQPIKEEIKQESVETPVQPVVNPTPVRPKQAKTGMPLWQKLVIIGLTLILLLMIFIVIVVIAIIVFTGAKNNPTRTVSSDTRTVMIYLDGSNLESEAGIVSSELSAINPSSIDLDRVNVLLYTGGTTKWHNFISNKENAIYKLTDKGFEKVQSYSKQNMGDPTTLTEFLKYSYENYPAGHYNLLLYNHGGAIDGAIYDDFTHDNLTLEDFEKALKNSDFNPDNKMDTVIFRTCLNGTLEVASVFDDYAKYIIFSEEITLGASTSNVLGYFLNGIDSTSDGVAVGNKFIDSYNKQMEDIDILGTQAVTYSIIDLSKVKPLIEKLDNYITTINLTDYYREVSTIRNNMYQYGKVEPSYDTVDLKEFINQVRPYATGDADGLIKAIDETVIKNKTNLSKSNGLSVYFPFNGKQAIINRFLKVYDTIDFSDNYKRFISAFITAKGETSSFKYDIGDNKTFVTESNEVTLELTEEQKATIVKSSYYVFRKDKGSNSEYFKGIFASNNSTIENGIVSTHMDNKFIKISENSLNNDPYYIFSVIDINDNNVKKYVNATITDKDEDVISDSRSVTAELLIEDENGTPKFGKMQMISRDERVQGILYDTSKYEKVLIPDFKPRLLDSKGNTIKNDKWTFPNTKTAYEADLDDVKLEYSGMDDGEFYVIFFLYDYNGNMYQSDLIKVGE